MFGGQREKRGLATGPSKGNLDVQRERAKLQVLKNGCRLYARDSAPHQQILGPRMSKIKQQAKHVGPTSKKSKVTRQGISYVNNAVEESLRVLERARMNKCLEWERRFTDLTLSVSYFLNGIGEVIIYAGA
jgi:hypothetical protein